jgi:hypothetical protein
LPTFEQALAVEPYSIFDELTILSVPSSLDDVMVKLRFSEKPIHREPCRRTDTTSIGPDAT